MKGRMWFNKQMIEFNDIFKFDDLLSNHPIFKQDNRQEITVENKNEFNITRGTTRDSKE
jgi:hypothetical protein